MACGCEHKLVRSDRFKLSFKLLTSDTRALKNDFGMVLIGWCSQGLDPKCDQVPNTARGLFFAVTHSACIRAFSDSSPFFQESVPAVFFDEILLCSFCIESCI